MCFISGHYTDIHSLFGGQVGRRRDVQSVIDDDGHYSDIPTGRDSVRGRSSFYEHYVDIDRVTAAIGDGDQPTTTGPGGVDHSARSRGYEELDPSVLATLRQPQRPHEYAGLTDGEAAATTQQTTEVIEMTTSLYMETTRTP